MSTASHHDEIRPRPALKLAVLIGALLCAAPAHAQEPKTKPAPVAPAGAQEPASKAAPVAPSGAQEPKSKPAPPAADDDAVEALSLRYRFREHYSSAIDPDHPEYITQYQIGARETQKVMRDNPEGAPIRGEMVRQTIYTERVAKATKTGDPTDAIRRYDRYFYKDYSDKDPTVKGAFQGLAIWLREQPGQFPLVLNLTPERPIREFEFAAVEKLVSPSRLKGILPPTPTRIGDAWRIPLPASVALLGETPDPENYSLEGTLIEVRKAKQPPGHEAVIGVQGQFTTPGGPSAVNARITFSFAPPVAKPPAEGAGTPAPRPRTNPGEVEARGQISEVRLARVVTGPIPGSKEPLQQTTSYELLLARRPTLVGDGADPATALIPLPETPPKPDQANSWILHDDPRGRFHFFHPQELKVDQFNTDADVVLVNPDQGLTNVVAVSLQKKETSPERDRLSRDPEHHRKNFESSWAKQSGAAKHKNNLVKGAMDWLPADEWAPSKRKVYRIEAALKGDAPTTQRLYIDYYLVVFPSNQSIVVNTVTSQDPHVPFRDQAESLIKSFGFGPSRPHAPVAR